MIRITLNRRDVFGQDRRIQASIFLQDLRYLLVLKTSCKSRGDLQHHKVNSPHDFKQCTQIHSLRDMNNTILVTPAAFTGLSTASLNKILSASISSLYTSLPPSHPPPPPRPPHRSESDVSGSLHTLQAVFLIIGLLYCIYMYNTYFKKFTYIQCFLTQ